MGEQRPIGSWWNEAQLVSSRRQPGPALKISIVNPNTTAAMTDGIGRKGSTVAEKRSDVISSISSLVDRDLETTIEGERRLLTSRLQMRNNQQAQLRERIEDRPVASHNRPIRC